ncbi:MAG: universal stress protein [Thermoleophilia bacterium]
MSPFDRVVCGVDGSPEGLVAVRQAGRLARERVVLVAVVDAWELVLGAGDAGPPPRADLRRDAEAALTAARDAVGASCAVETRLIEGAAAVALLDEASRCEATLLAVGTHGRSRAAGIVLGSVASSAVHHAPCSVLVARPPDDPGRFPSALVVGSDGSPEAALALAAGRDLRDRFGAALRVVAGGAPRGIDPDLIEEQVAPDMLVVSDRPPLEALVASSAGADLVVVGSRGLLGLPALASTSERIAHRAACSVLVVRAPSDRPPIPRQTLVRDLMSAPVVTARVDATIEDVARSLVEHGIGALAIVDADGRLVGIVTESDFAGREVVLWTTRYGTEQRAPRVLGELLLGDALERAYETARHRGVDAVMTTPVLAAVEDEPVQQALERMLHHRVGHLPVVRHGVPVGMLAHRDLLVHAATTWGEGDAPGAAGPG